MKVEGGGVAMSCSGAPTVLHKIKVKEEAKDCSSPGSLLQSSSSSSSSSSTGAPSASSSPPPRGAIGAIATITISSGCNGGGGELAAVAAKTPASGGASDAFPVDLDLKSRAKGPSRDRVPPRESDVNGTESRGSSSPSPSSSPGSHYHQPLKLTSQQQQQPSARSPDSDDQQQQHQGPPLQSLKTEVEDASHRQDEGSKCSEANGAGANSGRCISGIFAAHGKLKRLLGTLVQFAMDISPDTGDTVRTLVLGLLSGSMSAEEFHSALQEATNFPLRGFVLPYLKHTLPSLQRDLSAAARADNQTCAQYLRSNESAVLEAVGLGAAAPVESAEGLLFAEHASPAAMPVTAAHHYAPTRPNSGAVVTTTNTAMHAQGPAAVQAHLGYAPAHGQKRRASDAIYYENGAAFDDGPPYKRSANPWAHHHHQHHPHAHPQHQPTGHPSHPGHHPHQPLPHHQQQQQQQHPADVSYCWYTHPLHPSSAHHPSHGAAAAAASLIPSLVQIGASGSQPGYGPLAQAAAHLTHQPAVIAAAHAAAATGGAPTQNGSGSLDDEWKNIHVMLNCILGMVEKTKRALAILQKRGCTSPAAAPANLQAPSTNGPQAQLGNGTQEAAAQDGTFKRLSGEIIRATEDRVAEVKRKAEEAVQEVKRAAVAEVQRAVAVAVAESRASERLRSQRYLDSLPMSQQQHQHQQQQQRVHPATAAAQQQQHARPSPFLRLAVEARTASGTSGTATSSTGATEDEKDAHLVSGTSASCWNCGRPALETCGGCGVARYCGAFCQHRDWEAGGHHATCSTTSSSSPSQQQQQHQQQQHHESRVRSPTPSPPRPASSEHPDAAKATSSSLSSSSSSSSSVLQRPVVK